MDQTEKQEFLAEMRTEMRQLFGVFMETIDYKFAIILERLDIIQTTLDMHTETIAEILVALDSKADVRDVDILERRVKILEQKKGHLSK